jgi:CBS domain-containing protein
MIEWNYRQIPVIERNGEFQGLLGIQEVLAASLNHETADNEHIRDAEAPTPIRLIMQTSVPHIRADQPLAAALGSMLRARRGFVAVLDEQGGLAGMLDDETAIARLQGEKRQALLLALQNPQAELTLPDTGYPVGDFVQVPAIMLAPEEPINQATRRLLEHDLERLPIVDGDQRFLGIVARGALLRALEQEDE